MTDYSYAVRKFMDAFDQSIRTTPTADITPEEQVLRVQLVVEEALEFAEAMGVTVAFPIDLAETQYVEVARNRDKIRHHVYQPVDLVEAADALADLHVVTFGSEITMGIPGADVFDAVHESNMEKLVNGKPLKNEIGRVVKPEGWRPPNIKQVLLDDGWDGK